MSGVLAHTLALALAASNWPGSSKVPEHRSLVFLTTAPLSYLSLFVNAEVEFAVTPRVAPYFAVGGGPLFGQLGGEVGVRAYVRGHADDGFFLDGHGSFFAAVPRAASGNRTMVLAGGGALFGVAGTSGLLRVSLGVGFNVFGAIDPGHGVDIGLGQSPAVVSPFPGLHYPPPGRAMVTPVLRAAIGFAF